MEVEKSMQARICRWKFDPEQDIYIVSKKKKKTPQIAFF